MIKVFIKWIEVNQSKLAERGITVVARRDKKLQQSDALTAAVAEFESARLIGTIIYYHTGEYDVNVFQNSAEGELKEAFLEVSEPKNENELLALLHNTFERIYLYHS